MNKPTCVIVHHTGVSYTKNPDQYNATNNYHKSLGWGGIGYHYEISRDGVARAGRSETVEGAHTYGMNSKSIGIAIDGNFDQELPTEKQKTALAVLLKGICKRWNIPKSKIYPHRKFAKKTCYGSKLSETWAADLLDEPPYDEAFARSLDKEFLLCVDDHGKIYYVRDGVKTEIPKETTVADFATKAKILIGIGKKDADRIRTQK